MFVEDDFIFTLKPCCVCWTVAMDRERLHLAEGFWVKTLTTNRIIFKTKKIGEQISFGLYWTLSEFVSVCKSNESRKTCGAKKILHDLSPTGSLTTISETWAKKALENFFYSSYDEALFYRSSKVGVQHRHCFAKKATSHEDQGLSSSRAPTV